MSATGYDHSRRKPHRRLTNSIFEDTRYTKRKSTKKKNSPITEQKQERISTVSGLKRNVLKEGLKILVSIGITYLILSLIESWAYMEWRFF